MRLIILAVGRARRDPAHALATGYLDRLSWPAMVREVTLKTPLSPAEQPDREGALLLAALPDSGRDGRVVALDGRGRALGSDAFAGRLGAWRDAGVPWTAFLIGGAYGLSDAVRHRADLVLSFGPMTWPHMLVRPMLAEQLYRAQQILVGHPYHHG